MTSLCPGTLFSYAGFNKKSTPTPPQITSEELSRRYKRESYNGRPWPNASPTAGVYDIGFSSTQLILLNYQRKRESKLRGTNDPAMDADIFPNPSRHFRTPTPTQKEKPKRTSSPSFRAPRVGHLEWTNYDVTAEERFKFEDGSMVNPRHHTSCLVSSDPDSFRMGMTYSEKRPSSHVSLPPNFRSSPMLTHKDLSKGEKQYLYSIAKIYSASQMMKLKQEQYNQLLAREMEKGLYTPDEYQQYLRYIQMGRKRQYLRSQGRAASAPLMRMFDNADNKRPGLYPSSVRGDSDSRPASQREGSISDKPSRPTSKRSTKSLRPTVPARTSISSDQSKSKPDSANQTKGKQESTNQTKESSKKSGEKEESSDTSESTAWDPNRKSDHKEGGDRPKSRIGHIPEDAKSSKSLESSEQETTSKEDTTKSQQSSEKDQQQIKEQQLKEQQLKEQQQKEQQLKEQQQKEQQLKEQQQKEQQLKEQQQKEQQLKEQQQKEQQLREELQREQQQKEQQKKEQQQKEQQLKEQQQKEQQLKEQQQKEQQLKEQQQKEQQLKEQQQKEQQLKEQQQKEQQLREELQREQQQKEQQQKEQQQKEEQQLKEQQLREELQREQQLKEQQQKEQREKEQQQKEQQELLAKDKQQKEEDKAKQQDEESSRQKEDAKEDKKSNTEEDKKENKEEKSSSDSEHESSEGSDKKRDSISSYELDEVSKVNKDPDKLEY